MLLRTFWLVAALCGLSHGLYGGTEADIKNAPHQVSIWERQHHSCGGSIISDRWVLSLSSCVDAFIENFSVHAGASDSRNGSVHRVTLARYHIDIFGGKANAGQEPVLLYVDPPIPFDSTRQPIALVPSTYQLPPNQTLRVTGYGRTNGFLESWHLRSVETRSMLLEDCVKTYGDRFGSLYPGLMCTRAEGVSGCSGDAGNPVATEDNKLVAISTSRQGCGRWQDEPDVHVSVARVRDWIRLYAMV